MKKISIILIFASSLTSFAQGPTILGTYLPVRGTSVKEVWDTVNNYTAVPTPGQNQFWDYSVPLTEFSHVVDTFQLKTFHPDSTSTRYHQYFPNATHASWVRTPFNRFFICVLYC